MDNIKEATTKVVHNGERVVNNGQPEQSAIAYCEEMYPQTCEEFKNILDEMYVTFCKKQRNYGP